MRSIHDYIRISLMSFIVFHPIHPKMLIGTCMYFEIEYLVVHMIGSSTLLSGLVFSPERSHFRKTRRNDVTNITWASNPADVAGGAWLHPSEPL